MQSNSLIADILLGVITCVLIFGLGFFVGRSSVSPYERVDRRPKKISVPEPEPEDDDDNAVIDSSPEHLKEKFDQRIRSGEDPIDEDESQIITDKTPEQIREAVEAEKEAKLDKWMPGIKDGQK